MKMKMKTYQAQNTEAGNVLFLILIAVALFAALSYAVTSSTNSGGGDANDESNLVNSAAVTQFPAGIKTALIRMQVSKGVVTPSADTDLDDGAEGFLFDKPPYTGVLTADTYRAVFHPNGGGATYSNAPASVMAVGGANTAGVWFFNMDFEVTNVGTTAAGIAGNEIIAFLPGISSSICNRINQELGISGDIITDAALNPVDGLLRDDSISTANPADNAIGTDTAAAALDGQLYGCFQDNAGGDYIYYHVLLER